MRRAPRRNGVSALLRQAPALMAVGAPRRDLMRRMKAPMAVLLCMALWAARRRAAAARLAFFRGLLERTLPPLIRLLGATLSHAQKCFSLGQRLISRPISERILCTARKWSRGIWVRPPPAFS